MYSKIFGMLFFLVAMPLYGTVDQSYNLNEVLEQGTLSKKDCDAYNQGNHDQETTLRCGKWMFFYDSMNRAGYPADLLDLLRKNAPNTIGASLEGVGLIPDPYSKSQLPVGMVPGVKLTGTAATYTETCAGCHFGKLPDGRYQVGQPNSRFDFARLTLATSVLPQLALMPKTVLPELVSKKLQPVTDEFFGAKWSRLAAIIQTLKLIPSSVILKKQPMTDDEMIATAEIKPGSLDPISAPGYDDKVKIPLRILPLWGLKSKTTMEAAGSTHGAMLTSTGGTPDFANIYHTGTLIVDIVAGTKLDATFDANSFEPLTQYILSLTAPKNQLPFDPQVKEAGARLFAESCSICHNGPGYAGTKIYKFEDIGTDSALANMYGIDGVQFKNIVEPDEITHGLRAPRLEGWWAMRDLLHNGSLKSFEELLCVDGPRPVNLLAGQSTAGHTYGCDTYDVEQKQSLIHFLESL